MHKQKGMVALVITMTILAIITIITLFTARVIVTDNKIFNNVKNNADALNAAQSGFEYALGYFNAYPYIVANGLGYCASASNTYALTSGSLANGATYTMTFSCITAGNFVTVSLSTVGTSQDGTSTRTISSTLKQYCNLSQPLTSKGAVTIGTTATPVVSNQYPGATRTIDTGGTVTLNNGGTDTTITGGAYSCAAGGTPPTTCLNNRTSAYANPPTTALSSITNPNLEQLYLGGTIASFAALATAANTVTCPTGGGKTFTSIANGGGCTLGAGLTSPLLGGSANNTGKIIYMNMSGGGALTLTTSGAGTSVLGTVAAPVILVINTASSVTLNTANSAGRTLTINGNIYTNGTVVTIRRGTSATDATLVRGLVYSDAPLTVTRGAVVNGAVVGGSTVSVSYTPSGAAANILYDSTGANYIANTYHGYCGGAYAIVPGSWRDF